MVRNREDQQPIRLDRIDERASERAKETLANARTNFLTDIGKLSDEILGASHFLEEAPSKALSLDVRERAALAEKLLASLEHLSEEESERLWAEEAERRLAEYRAGRARAVSAEEVFRCPEVLTSR